MISQIELAAPAVLTLAAARLHGRPAQLGVALQHPPVHLCARQASQLAASGACADQAYRYGEKFISGQKLEHAASLEIELAIPAHMGLGSAPLVGLSAARALATLAGRPHDDAAALAAAAGLDSGEGLATQAFGQGGLLLVDQAGAALRRRPIAHRRQPDDWVFVLVLPRPPAGIPENLEAQGRRRLWQLAAGLDGHAERLLSEQLWPAVEADDIGAFGAALMELRGQIMTDPVNPAEEAIMAIMRAGGALAWGRALSGLGSFGLVRGAEPSRRLRMALAAHLGHSGGTILATICDNQGARQRNVS